MKRVKNDPMRDKPGTLQVHYRAITDGGLSIEATTRTFRCSEQQRERLEAFITELYEGTPEIPRPDEPPHRVGDMWRLADLHQQRVLEVNGGRVRFDAFGWMDVETLIAGRWTRTPVTSEPSR